MLSCLSSEDHFALPIPFQIKVVILGPWGVGYATTIWSLFSECSNQMSLSQLSPLSLSLALSPHIPSICYVEKHNYCDAFFRCLSTPTTFRQRSTTFRFHAKWAANRSMSVSGILLGEFNVQKHHKRHIYKFLYVNNNMPQMRYCAFLNEIVLIFLVFDL